MAKQTYARPAVLITHTRSGGTFLNYCLSTHRRIFWTRGEPLLRQMEWGQAFPDVTDMAILDCITRASFYTIAGCKITYEQMNGGIWEWLEAKKVKVIHLVRRNMIRVAVSQIVTGLVATQRIEGHRAHSFDVLEVPKITLSPDRIIARAARQVHDIQMVQKRLEQSGLDVFSVQYRQFTGEEGREASQLPEKLGKALCEFLGVRYEHMTCDLRRVNRGPLSSFIENWPAVERALKGSRFAQHLEDERIWEG